VSNALAIATVTAVLKNLLDNLVVDDSLVATGTTPVKVSVGPPDFVKSTGDTDRPTQLNLYLYHVAPNQGWRNVGLPSRGDKGGRLTNPPLALDLYYLLTVYGAKDFEQEILLGYAMQVLHENPVIPRDWIRKTTTPPPGDTPPVTGQELPPPLNTLSASTLADQIEQIRLTLQPMGTEEMSKLWTAFQTNHRPSVAYLATVVLIEPDRAAPSAPPVRQRNLLVVPFRKPLVTAVNAAPGPGQPADPNLTLAPGVTVLVEGQALKADGGFVQIDGGPPVTPSQASDSRLWFALPAGLSPGIRSLQVAQPFVIGTPPAPHPGLSSPAFPFVLPPVVVGASAVDVTLLGSPHTAQVSVTLNLSVGTSQKVRVLLTRTVDDSPVAYPSADPLAAPATTATATAVVPNGSYVVRVQVDGAESPVTRDASGQITNPLVAIP